MRIAMCFTAVFGLVASLPGAAATEPEVPPGFVALFNGKNLAGWHGEATIDPDKRRAMPAEELAKRRVEDDADMVGHWMVNPDGELVNDGQGVFLTTDEDYGDVELLIDWQISPGADSGVYLRGAPQVQIWDFTDPSKFDVGAAKGSGGLWNNAAGMPGKDPLVVADRLPGEWNRFHIVQLGDKTTVRLNGAVVVDGATMENHWDRLRPLPASGPIQLQTHGGETRWKNIFVREIPPDEANRRLRGTDPGGFVPLFNGTDLSNWAGAVGCYRVEDGEIVCIPGEGGVLHTGERYGDFAIRLEFQLPAGGNNGLAVRYPGSGDPAYSGMCEVQLLDSEHPKYAGIDPRQHHGSAYGMVAAHRGHLRPAGQWNYQQVTVKGSSITVELNGTTILDADLSEVTEFMGGRSHPAKDIAEGFVGFSGHGDPVRFRNVSIRRLGP